jgi:hypothetical protein
MRPPESAVPAIRTNQEKENILKLQTVIRAVVCAAIVATLIASAVWFTARPVAGRESKEQTLQGAAALGHLKRNGQDSEAASPLAADVILTPQQRLIAADGAYFDHSGYAVALDGDTMVVGAPWNNSGANYQRGSVYVFTRNGATWTLQQKLIADFSGLNACFGWSVALDGDTLAVGAPGDTINGNVSRGSAYVFTRSGATWTQQQKLIASDGEAVDQFGEAVAIDGDTLVAGAGADKIGGNVSQGSAYVFMRSGATWTQQQKLIANDGAPGAFFGRSLALDGDTLAVGAPDDTINGKASQGSAYVLTRNGATWTQQQKLTGNVSAAYDHFGRSVALDGDMLVAGAYGDDFGDSADQGSAYVFARSGPTWHQTQQLQTGYGESAAFGFSVALSNNTLVVGSAFDNIGGNSMQGSVYVYVPFVCPTLNFTPAGLPNGSTLAPYQQWVGVSNLPGSYEFVVSSGALPPGISLAPHGLLSGMPTTPGSYTFTITATDQLTDCSGSWTYTITITSCPNITIMPSTLPDGARGMVYSQTMAATGGAAPYSFYVAKTALLPSLPPGLSLSQNGVLSGKPTTAGVFGFTVYVRDANGCVGSLDYTLNIAFAGGGGESGVAPNQRR